MCAILTSPPMKFRLLCPFTNPEDFAEKIVSVDIVGEPAPGHTLISARVNPSTILVAGGQLPFNVQTEPIDILTGLTETSDVVTLILPLGH